MTHSDCTFMRHLAAVLVPALIVVASGCREAVESLT
jgi:hypothetical protein